MGKKLWALGLALVFGAVAPSFAHETDQFTTPPGREFADLGDHMTAWVYDTLDRAVQRLNADIQRDRDAGMNDVQILREYDEETVASAVFHSFPNAYDVIEGMERRLYSADWKSRYPGQVVGFKAVVGHTYQFAHLPIDIRQLFKLWFASTIKVHGTYLGTDKLGHFTDMGHNYYSAYIKAMKSGKSEQQAHSIAVKLGTDHPLFSESGLLGNISAGAYSNADLMSNYAGYLFYRNLLHPMKLKGVERPALLVREGATFRLAPHVARSSDFFSWFISDHWDEALNPSLFDFTMRGGIRSAVRTRAPQLLWRYRDEHGCTRSPQYFDAVQRSLAAYYGDDYGHRGKPDELVLLSDACFEPVAADKSANHVNPTGHNALHWAVLMGDLPTVQRLVDRGFDVNAPMKPQDTFSSIESGYTPLHLAVHGGLDEIARFLLERKALVSAASKHGITPLHLAGQWPDLVSLLIGRGAAVNTADKAGRTPLHWAALDKAASVAELLAGGADVAAADHASRTPLHVAAESGSAESVATLSRQGGSTVNTADPLGVTPLHLAADRGDAAVLNALLDAGADVGAVDAFGYSPLHAAAARGRITATLLLLQKGASAQQPDSIGNTPLHLACRYGRREIAILLINADADVRAANSVGMTPLHEAAHSGDRTVYHLLVQEGASESVRNRRGLTPRQTAKSVNESPRVTGTYKGTSTAGGALGSGASTRHIGR